MVEVWRHEAAERFWKVVPHDANLDLGLEVHIAFHKLVLAVCNVRKRSSVTQFLGHFIFRHDAGSSTGTG